MNSNQPIGIFDSGIGGLTVLSECLKKMPHENYIYVADFARVPYGNRSPQEIVSINFEILDFLKQKNVKAVLIACNTSSAVALQKDLERYEFPIWGLIQPVSAGVLEKSSTKKIAVLATATTVNSHAYQNQIQQMDSSAQVLEVACPEFVPIVEQDQMETSQTASVVSQYMQQVNQFGADCIVHGCSHYPYLQKVMEQFVENVHFLDPAFYLVRQAQKILDLEDLLTRSEQPGQITYYETQKGEKGIQFVETSDLLKQKQKVS